MNEETRRIDFTVSSEKIVLNRQVIIDLSNDAVLTLKKMRENGSDYGNKVLIRLNSLILETCKAMLSAPENIEKEHLSHRLIFITEVRDLFASLIK